MNNKKCEIILNGYKFSNIENDRFIIACDGAWNKINHNKVKVNLLIGDFDSIKGEIPDNLPFLKFPKEKDDTDSILAVKWAINNQFNDIKINGAFGGRLDHEYANLQCGIYASTRVEKVIMEDNNNLVTFIYNTSKIFPKREGFSLSVFSASEICESVTITGTKYEISNKELTNSFPIGISNEWKEKYAEISVKNGILIVIQSKISPN